MSSTASSPDNDTARDGTTGRPLLAPDPNIPPAPPLASAIVSFAKQLAVASADLHLITAPATVLNGRSVLEYGRHWAEYPRLLAATTSEDEGVRRMVAVVRWFVSTLFGAYASRAAASGSERKPYNPVLGEQFRCHWPEAGDVGETRLVSEQVAHHPPVSALYIENRQARVFVNCHFGQRTRFTGTAIKAEQVGTLFLHNLRHGEQYAMTLPDLYVRSILTGYPFLELVGSVSILCTNGLAAELQFLPKPWFTGQYDHFEGIIYEAYGEDRRRLVALEGQWSGRSWWAPHVADDGDAQDDIEGRGQLLYECLPWLALPATVAPLAEQGPMESQRIWAPVTRALFAQDYVAAAQAKHAVEESQRALRRQRAEEGIHWRPEHFGHVPFFFAPARGGETGTSRPPAADGAAGAEEGDGRASSQHAGRWIYRRFHEELLAARPD